MRELNAVLDVTADYCVIPKGDAYWLGYYEAANDDPVTPAGNTLDFISYDGYGKVALINVARVDMGSMTFRDVDFVAFELHQRMRFEALIGRSILQFTKLEFDYSLGELTIEEAPQRSVEE